MNLNGIDIQTAKKSDEQEIRRLWKDCFDDDDSYLDLYFQNHTNFEQIILLKLDGNIIGMIHQLPCKIINGKDALYWYAVGIAPNFRNKGYFKHFCSEVLKQNQKNGFSNVCQPIKGLEAVYQKLGFCYAYFAKETSFFGNSSSDPIIKLQKAVPEDFNMIALEKGSVSWDANHIKYALTENLFCEGKNLKFQYQEKNYVFMAIKKDDSFLLDHTNIPPDVAASVQNSILKKLGCSQFILRHSANRESENRFIVGLSDDCAVNDASQLTFTLA